MKEESKGEMRELAKLFLNNRYGTMTSSTDSSFKLTYMKYDKTIGFLPVGSAITSYARNFIIIDEQNNYHGEDKRGFIYADTDSIHSELSPDEITDISVHPKKLLLLET